MALSMARPWKHPDSGYYWFRKRVPDDLKSIVGKGEERFSLGTRDPIEAKRVHALRLAEIEERWSNLRKGQHPLGTDEITHEALAVGDILRQQLSADPFQDIAWDTEIGAELWSSPQSKKIYADVTQPLDSAERRKIEQQDFCFALADERLSLKGRSVGDTDRRQLARVVSIEIQRIVQAHRSYLRGLSETNFNTGSMLPVQRVAGPPLQFDALIEGWVLEKKPIRKTEYVWRRVMKELASFVGHDDARRIRADDLVSWKAHLLAKGLKAKTIRDGKLAPVRAIFQWATDNRKIDNNPGARINIDLKARSSEKRRGYSDEEARVVLLAARRQSEPHRRWAPWVSAFTGARIAEVCQLRREDIRKIDGIDCIAFAAEAGSLKNVNSERVVPVHPALESEGFLKFAESIKSGPLFMDLMPDRFDSRGGTGAKVLSRWIRSLGLTDKRISPNHSWRHRLKTLGRRHGLAVDIMDAMTGHGRKTVADTYGEFPPAAMLRELNKIPALKFED